MCDVAGKDESPPLFKCFHLSLEKPAREMGSGCMKKKHIGTTGVLIYYYKKGLITSNLVFVTLYF